MQTETAKPESFTEAVGISIEREEEIKNSLAAAVKEFFQNEQYESKSDALYLAINHCKPKSIVEAVLIGMILQAAVDKYNEDPVFRIIRDIFK